MPGSPKADTAPKIVIAEVDDAIRNSLCFALHADGLMVEAFANGADLLANPASFDGAAYILDHHLRDMSGPELLVRLRV